MLVLIQSPTQVLWRLDISVHIWVSFHMPDLHQPVFYKRNKVMSRQQMELSELQQKPQACAGEVSGKGKLLQCPFSISVAPGYQFYMYINSQCHTVSHLPIIRWVWPCVGDQIDISIFGFNSKCKTYIILTLVLSRQNIPSSMPYPAWPFPVLVVCLLRVCKPPQASCSLISP